MPGQPRRRDGVVRLIVGVTIAVAAAGATFGPMAVASASGPSPSPSPSPSGSFDFNGTPSPSTSPSASPTPTATASSGRSPSRGQLAYTADGSASTGPTPSPRATPTRTAAPSTSGTQPSPSPAGGGAEGTSPPGFASTPGGLGFAFYPGLADGFPALATPVDPRSTVDILQRLATMKATPEVALAVLVPFPVIGPASYADDWAAPRFAPSTQPRSGIDITAARGTPVIAVADGTITARRSGGADGNALVLTTGDRTQYRYAHLDSFAGATQGQPVTAGTLLGYVGTSGDTTALPPRLNLQIRPQGGAATSPVAQLDRWLAQARTRLAALSTTDNPVLAPLVAPAPGQEVVPFGLTTAAGSGIAATLAGERRDPSRSSGLGAPEAGGTLAVLLAAVAQLATQLRLRRQRRTARDPRVGFLAGAVLLPLTTADRHV